MFDTKRIENCPVTAANGVTVYVAPELREPLLVALYGWSDEFIALLEGSVVDRTVHVTGITIPEQHNGAATCELVDNGVFDTDRYIGFLHSHVNFGAFHSCTDAKGVDNAPVSLVISRVQGGLGSEHPIAWSGKIGVVLPCGNVGVLKATSVQWAAPPDGGLQPAWAIPTDVSLSAALNTDCPHYPVQPCGVVGMVRDYSLYNAVVNNTVKEPAYIDRRNQHWDYKTQSWVDDRHTYTTGTKVTDKRKHTDSTNGGDSSSGAVGKGQLQLSAPSANPAGGSGSQPAYGSDAEWQQCQDCGYWADGYLFTTATGLQVCDTCRDERGEGQDGGNCDRCKAPLALEASIAAGRCSLCRERERDDTADTRCDRCSAVLWQPESYRTGLCEPCREAINAEAPVLGGYS